MIDSRLDPDFRQRLHNLHDDWGNAYAGPAGQKEVWVWPAALSDVTELPAGSVEALVTLTSPLEPMRRDPNHRSELVSEVRTGEWMQRLASEGEWSLVVNEDGYVGWVCSWVLREQTEDDRRSQMERYVGVLDTPVSTLWVSDTWAAGPAWLGTPLLHPAEGPRQRGPHVLVELPHGPQVWIERDQLAEDSPPSLVFTALRLLGVPYRWGGRSPGGFDCSGLTQLAALRVGLALPRDSSQQARCGDPLPLDPSRWQRDDLLFFGDPVDHVGLYDGRDAMIHCSAFGRRQALSEISQLMGRLSHARRLTDHDRIQHETLWQRRVEARPTA